MIRRSQGGFRLTFLQKFVVVTFALYVVVASALALFLIDRHQVAIEDNEAINAAGQISALATKPLGALDRDDVVSTAENARLATLVNAAKQLQYVEDLRIYGTDGRSIYPATGPVAPAEVRRTLQTGDLWSQNATTPDGYAVRTEFVPFASSRAIFVLAIDLSRQAMQVQAFQEARGIVVATALAIGSVFIALVALAAGASRELERRRREAKKTFLDTLGVLADAIDRRDPYTAGHSRRVATYSRLLARELGMSSHDINVAESAALLHDLGKIGIPDAVLLKPGKLDERERAIMSTHPRIGSEIIAGVAMMDDVTPCVLHHHERLDGNGYPDHLRGNQIPRGSRVIAIADTFDAITTDRPYRRAVSAEAAMCEMRRVAGTQLEAEFVEAFGRLIASGVIVPPQPAPLDTSLDGRFGPRVPVELRV